MKAKLHIQRYVAVGLLMIANSASAYILDWTNESYTAGSLNETLVDVNGSGVDIRFRTTVDTGFFEPGFPDINTDFTGGLSSGYENLEFWVDSWTSDTQRIRIRTEFFWTGTNQRAKVHQVDFTIFDVDRGGGTAPNYDFQDQVRNFRASNQKEGGAWFGPSITTSSNNTLTGSGTTQRVTGTGENPNNSANGNVGVDFGSNILTRFQFVYRNGPDAQADPLQQSIGLYDIEFQVIPERGVTVAFAIFAILGVVMRFVGRKELRYSS